jgi:hypothetical protein
MSETEQLLYDHREGALTCLDHVPTPDKPVWCCVCGDHGLTVSWRAHVAAYIDPTTTASVGAPREER